MAVTDTQPGISGKRKVDAFVFDERRDGWTGSS